MKLKFIFGLLNKMTVFSRNLYFVITFSLFSNSLISQTNNHFNTAEFKYLIEPTFKNNKKEQAKLTAIFNEIILGNYKKAKEKIIQSKKQAKENSTFYFALLSYEATIYYNESDYQKSIDSCDFVLNNLQNNNSFFLKALNLKAKSKAALNELDESKNELDLAIKTAKKINDYYNLSTSYYLYGSILNDKGDFTTSNNYFYKSLRIKNQIGDSIGIAGCYAFLGLNYANMSNYSKGISLLHKSISIREKIKDKRGLANSYLSLYKIYFDNGEIEKALKSELKSLSICREINDYQCISGRLTNIGELYNQKKDFKKALEYHNKALIISRKINTKNKIALIHQNIAKVYSNNSSLDLAKLHVDSSVLLNKKIGLKDAQLSSELILAEIYIKQNQYKKATPLVLNAIQEAEKLKSPIIQKEAHKLASTIYNALKQNDKSLIHYKLFISIRDSIENIEKSKDLTKKEFEYEYLKKAEIFKLKQKEKLNQIEERNNLQKIISLITILALLIVTILFTITLRLNKQKLLTKEDLEKTNQILVNKNREILDSISYAKRIQSAILPQEKLIKTYLPNSFIFYKPKDIVAGDFYWFEVIDNLIFFAAADCTGHGVPGAMVSVVCNNALNRSVKEFALKDPAEILNRTREIVIAEFEKSDEDVKDGMDISLCALNIKTNQLKWSGANNPLWILRKNDSGVNELVDFKGDKQPIGKHFDAKPFTQTEIQLQKNDSIYIFTDGFQDQFGGLKEKKFRAAQLKNIFLSSSDKKMEEQRKIINEAFENWKGELEQVDDVCVIGVKV